jgi:hypothetical protein
MRKQLFTLFFLLLGLAWSVPARAQARLYELRIYTCSPGKLQDVVTRFREHAVKYFPKYNMKLEGFWVPTDNPENKIYWLVSYPDRAARDQSWKGFSADRGWQRAKKRSVKNGEIVAKVEEVFLAPTDFSPNQMAPVGDRVFELRIYRAHPGKMNDLLARFRNHTLALFAKHGMTNIFYATSTEADQATQPVLYYWLAHRDQPTAAQNFKNFGADPAWRAAASASEANGKLVEKITSVFMAPSDFSPVK